MSGRLSTCAVCRGTIEQRPGAVAGWGHVSETARNADGHLPQVDDGAVSGPGLDDLDPVDRARAEAHEHGLDDDEVDEHVAATEQAIADGEPLPQLGAGGCEWCPTATDTCLSSCGCPPCEVERARDADADMYADR